MKVTVEYAAQVKKAARVGSEVLDVDSATTLQQLVALVVDKHGAELRSVLFAANGDLQRSILVFVSDQQVRWDEHLELKEGDVVTLLSPISGG
jgi:molybdopterin converting factor small subunit